MGQMLPENIAQDIGYLLDAAVCSPVDELALLRTSLRAYLEGMTAADAVAWAANEISNSLTSYT